MVGAFNAEFDANNMHRPTLLVGIHCDIATHSSIHSAGAYTRSLFGST